ncbi:hypothetical protein PUNSTDRAFT_134161 [Punctularia strigosozonata HHB-11173 SS5]|uniref:uncharacterized protein n=1 Tax=Punctularia strigosozonata (strain HHB-11173) TaxID=741275 RepID=UPI000441792E|nr:uncharacterized protein PUNSTDRAFT_134161 [Punctularia strigosozonata HHB-11173 SS5]EIN08987.1 hypothetical protein PUNSTDRAFT_134161 [Punctularia strigosozonata HHB-11173 SS5]
MVQEDVGPDDCPLFHYGLGVPHDRLVSYAIRKEFIPAGATRMMTCSDRMLRNLTMICRARIRLAVVVHPIYDFVLSLYSNFSLCEDELSEDDEDEVIDILKRELNLDPDAEPLWYWDISTPAHERLTVKAPRKKKIGHSTLRGQENEASIKTSGVRPSNA